MDTFKDDHHVDPARPDEATTAPEAAATPASGDTFGEDATGKPVGGAEAGIRPGGDGEGFAERSETSHAALLGYLTAQGRDLDLTERLKSTYIGGERDDELRAKLDRALVAVATRRRDGGHFEGRGVAVVAMSAAGKSECIRRALRRHPLFASTGVNIPGCMALSVTCLGSCTLRILGELILAASGYDLEEGLRENEVWRIARHRLKMLGTLVVHVDEVNNLVENAHEDDRQRAVNNFKALINNADWPVVLLLSGTPSIGPVLKKDDQLRRRLDWIELKPLASPDDNETLAAFAGSLCRTAGIGSNPKFETSIAPRLVHASCRQLGLAAELGVEAVEAAVASGDAILTMEHFATAFARRAGCDAGQNPFVHPAWSTTDPRVALGLVQGEHDAGDGDPPPAAHPRGGRGRRGRRRSGR